MNFNDIQKKILEELCINKLIAGSTHFVKVTHINNPKDFYVRLASVEDNVTTLEVKGNSLTAQEIYIGKRVIYKSKLLKKCVRGNILHINEGTYNILAIDYGCYDCHVRLKHIYSTESKVQCPALAVSCQLSLCEPLGKKFSDKAIDAMYNFVGKDTAQITIISVSLKQKLAVELRTKECPGGVEKLLAMLNYTALGGCVNTVNRLTDYTISKPVINYKYKKLNVGDRLFTRVQSGNTVSDFYVAEINEYKNYVLSKADFKNYCMYQNSVDDVEEAAIDQRCCGVQVKSEYERAIVLRVTDTSKAIVKLIDWGNEIEIPFHCIKAVTSKCYNVRYASAIYCSSSDKLTWENGLPKFLYPGYQFIIEIVEVGNEKDVPHKVNIIPM